MSVGNKFGKDKKYDISEVKTVKGSYQTNFVYVQRGQSMIMLDNDQLMEYQTIMQQMSKQKEKVIQKPKFNLKTKIPTNLTKAQEKYQEKKAKTSVSIDQIPSQIYDGTFGDCFSCVDKNQEIKTLKNLNKLYRGEYMKCKREKQQLQQILKRNRQITQEHINENVLIQQQLLLIQGQCNKLKEAAKIQNEQIKKPLSSQYVDEVIKKQKNLTAKIDQLTQENKVLRMSNISKDEEIKQLGQSMAQQNPQLNSSMFKRKYRESTESILQLDLQTEEEEDLTLCD